MKPIALTHPSFAIVTAARCSGQESHLFGSATPGYNHVCIEVSEASTEFNPQLGIQSYHAGKRVLSLKMSRLQFAELVTGVSGGEGIPCTIDWRNGERIAPPPVISSVLEQIETDFRDDMDAVIHSKCDDLLDKARELRTKINVNKGDRDEFVKLAETLVAQIATASPYALHRFSAAVERMTAELKASRGEAK